MLSESAAIPDLRRLGSEITVRFPVRPLERARVVWLNSRWWLGCGLDITHREDRQDLEADLLARFGVSSALGEQEEQSGAHLEADRYGSSLGGVHGGSGRCGINGAYHGKGIGRTPLVPAEAAGFHADGRVSMAEAIREAVSAELAAVELPLGSVPVAAIIDTGCCEDEGEAIVVRPNFIRPAHFERAIFFGTAGFAGSDQQRDSFRTRNAVQAAVDDGSAIGFPGLPEMLERCARQIGAGHANRLWQGRFLSSNVSISGALVDFGSFRSVPSWRSFFGVAEEVFGREGDYLEMAWRSLAFSFQKYAPDHRLPPHEAVMERLRNARRDGFHAAIDRALGLDAIPSGARQVLCDALEMYFRHQQRERLQVSVRENWALPWIYDLLADPACADSRGLAAERNLLDAIRSVVIGRDLRFLCQALRRWTRPRPELHYENSTTAFHRAAASLRKAPGRGAAMIEALIRSTLSDVVRSWADIPMHFEIYGQTCHPESAVLYGYDHLERRWSAMMRGTKRGDRLHLFGTQLEPRDGDAGWMIVPAEPHAMLRGMAIRIGDREVTIPRALFRFTSGTAADPSRSIR